MYHTYTAVMCTGSDSKHFKKLHKNLSELPKANTVNITLYIFNACLHSVNAVGHKNGY